MINTTPFDWAYYDIAVESWPAVSDAGSDERCTHLPQMLFVRAYTLAHNIKRFEMKPKSETQRSHLYLWLE